MYQVRLVILVPSTIPLLILVLDGYKFLMKNCALSMITFLKVAYTL